MGSPQLSLCTTHHSLFLVGIGSLSQSCNRSISTSLLTGVAVWGGWESRIKHLCLFPHWPLDSGGWFTLAMWVRKSSQVFAEFSLTRNRLQIFPHVRQMNNRVVLINQSSSKPSTDGNNELLLHEVFLKQEEMSLTEMNISSSVTTRRIRNWNQIKPKWNETITNE